MPGAVASRDGIVQILVGGAEQTAIQLVCLLGPFFLVGLLLHGLERLVQRHLSRHFGWGSILWTGWLGTPVHETSHALLCLVFGHRIEEMALFKPDRESGRMGYVRHSWNPGNPYAVVGNFFIGVAPLAGGALVLYLFLWIFFPDAARGALDAAGMAEAIARGAFLEAGRSLFGMVTGVLGGIFTPAAFGHWKLWVFLYLVLCVGSHLAPSLQDYRGARRGALVLLLLLLAGNLVFLVLGGKEGVLMASGARVLGPALALFFLAAVLNSAIAVLVLGFTGLLDLIRGNAPWGKGGG